jgi:hypothetical protein
MAKSRYVSRAVVREERTADDTEGNELPLAQKLLDKFFDEELRSSGQLPPQVAAVKLTKLHGEDIGDPLRRNYIWLTAKSRKMMRSDPTSPSVCKYEVVRVVGDNGQKYVFERYLDFIHGMQPLSAAAQWLPAAETNKFDKLTAEELMDDEVFFESYDKFHRFAHATYV